MPLKVTSWNLEYAYKLIVANPSTDVLARRERVRQTLEDIDPDIICIQEGPKGEVAIKKFCKVVLNNKWVPILLKQPGDKLGDRDPEYNIKGTQWIWFLVRKNLENNCMLQPPSTWQTFTQKKTWKVHYWGQIPSTRHSHYRHPQVLIYDLGDDENIEIIGVHLKSKINTKKIEFDANNNLTGPYLIDALKSRVKLATEARNVREYIKVKFNQVDYPGILVMGDCNDGPGHDFFEELYLFFDLIGNLQGEVLVAERFFNHALFDFPGHLRWTAKFRDKMDRESTGEKPLLLDHIMISQPLCRGQLSLEVNEQAGLVEHEVFERVNAGSNSKTRTSDHRPITCVLDDVI